MWAWLKRLVADLIQLLSRPPAPPPPLRSPAGLAASKQFWEDSNG